MTVLVAVLAFIVAFEYAVIAFDIVPRLAGVARVERRTVAFARWGATAFLAGCAVTHTVIGLQTLYPSLRSGMDMAMASGGSMAAMLWQMVIPHLAQIVGGAVFIWISKSRLDVSITSKEEAVEQRQLDRQLKSAFHTSPLGIAFNAAADTGEGGTPSYANPAYLAILGIPADEPVPTVRDTLTAVHPADRAAAVAAMSRVRTGEAAEQDLRVVRPDGAVRWIHASWNPVTDDDGRLTADAVTMVEDITDRVIAHAALLDSEKRSVQLADSISVGINLRQLQPPKFLWANAAYRDIVGTDVGPYVGTSSDPALFVVHPDDRERVMSHYWSAAQAGHTVRSEHRVLRPDGQVRWVSTTSNPVPDEAGTVNRIAGTVEDITDRKTHEQALMEERRRLRSAEAVGHLGSWENDLMTGRPTWSAGMFHLWGVDPTTFDGDHAALREQIHPDDRQMVDAAIDRCRENGDPVQVRYRITRADSGAVRWIDVRGEARYEGGRRVRIVGAVADVSEEVSAAEEARANHAFHEAVIESSPDIIFVYDVATQATTWTNRSLLEQLGYPASDPAATGTGLIDSLIPEQERHEVTAAMAAAADTSEDQVIQLDHRLRAADGSDRWFSRRITAMHRDDQGRATELVGVLRDITAAQAAAAEEARANHAFHEAVIESSPDIIFVYDVATQATTWTNRSLLEQLGYPASDPAATGTGLIDSLIPEQERHEVTAAMAAAADTSEDQVIQLDHRLRAADGSDRWFSRRITAMHRDDQGRATELVGVLRDITAAMAAEQHLRHSALHDSLTGLPNRALLMDRLDGALSRTERTQREVSVLFCDLDGFKRVNDVAGHAVGDQVLLEITSRLKSALREGDTVARIGGDEFVIVIEPWNRAGGNDQPADRDADRALATRVAQRVGTAIRKPVVVDGVEYGVSVSIGIAYGTQPTAGHGAGITAKEILQDADTAMYRAKSAGKDRFEVFEIGMRTDVAERGRIERMLRQALRQTAAPDQINPDNAEGAPQLTAAYQPIFDSATGILVGFEALARLTDAHHRNIAPDLFIPIAEDTGLIQALGTQMLDLACGQLAAWRQSAPELSAVTMAVNMSALQAQHGTLTDDVHHALNRHGLAPVDLVLELTETALLHAGRSTIRSLQGMNDEGIGIAIDDFGTGYASLSYLATLPISALKIDRSFTAGLPENKVSQKIVNAVAGLAADLQLSCIVEGVESQAQRDALPAGVQLQGYLTGRPQQAHLLDPSTLTADRWAS